VAERESDGTKTYSQGLSGDSNPREKEKKTDETLTELPESQVNEHAQAA
jgi:hypothetical protein